VSVHEVSFFCLKGKGVKVSYGKRKYWSFGVCILMGRCSKCELGVCLFDSHTPEICDSEGLDDALFFPQIQCEISIRPLLKAGDLNLISRAFDCYIKYGSACENGDGDRMAHLITRMTRRTRISGPGGKRAVSNPPFAVGMTVRREIFKYVTGSSTEQVRRWRAEHKVEKTKQVRVPGVDHPWRVSERAGFERREKEDAKTM
jgi:hypothetical protein